MDDTLIILPYLCLTTSVIGAALGISVLACLVLLILVTFYIEGYGGIERRYTRRKVATRVARAVPPARSTSGSTSEHIPRSVLGHEGGGLGALGAFLVALLYRRLKPRLVLDVVIESGRSTTVVMLMIATSHILNCTRSLTDINNSLLQFFVGISRQYSPHISLTVLAVTLAVLGTFFDVIVLATAWGSVVISAFAPYGMSPYHIDALSLFEVLPGTATPPAGARVFTTSGVLKIGIEEVLKGVGYFIASTYYHTSP